MNHHRLNVIKKLLLIIDKFNHNNRFKEYLITKIKIVKTEFLKSIKVKAMFKKSIKIIKFSQKNKEKKFQLNKIQKQIL